LPEEGFKILITTNLLRCCGAPMSGDNDKDEVYWDKNAGLYDNFIEREHGELYKKVRKVFGKYVKRKHKVLDVATGTGDIALTLAKKSKDVIGIDLSSKMINVADSRATKNPKFIIGDVHEMEFERGEFDLVTCCNGLYVFSDPEQALSEMRRVLTAGGKLVTVTFAYGDADFNQKMQNWGQFLRLGMPPNWHSFTGPELRNMHFKAGLKILKAVYCWQDPPTVLIVARK
jgi:ubiquinone/menaquinone biosynthesis C-methylase UbiE